MKSVRQLKTNVSEPDWIRIPLGHWIRIRIRNPVPDLDPGGQKLPTKIEKFRNFMS
jgi:hypothetical protein